MRVGFSLNRYLLSSFFQYIHINPESRPVTDDIGKMAKIQFFHVGFGQTHGLGLVHIDGNRAFYRAYSRGVKGAPIGIICVLLMGHLVSSQHSVSSSRRKARMESRLSAMYACAFGSKKTPMYSMPDALVRLPLLIPCSLPWLVGIMMIAVPSSTLTKSPDATNQEETSA